jgi:hypothetical protein
MSLERWLDSELRAASLRSSATEVPTPRYASLDRTPRGRAAYGLAALFGSKAALAATASVALAAAGVGAKAATTGNPNPFNWGSQVTQQVKTCKAERSPGQHGIGQCVSGFAKQHGAAQRAQHSHGEGGGPGGHSTGHGGGHASAPPSPHPGQDGNHPTGPPSSPPSPKASGHPTGPPSPRP